MKALSERAATMAVAAILTLGPTACSRTQPVPADDLFTYEAPSQGVTVQQFIADMQRMTGRRIRMSEACALDSHVIRFVRPPVVRRSEVFDFFRSVLAAHLKSVVEVHDLAGDDLLVEWMDTTGSMLSRRRYPFLQAEALGSFAGDTESLVLTAIPVRRLDMTDLDEVIATVPRNPNRERWFLDSSLPWLIGYAHPANVAAVRDAIEAADREVGMTGNGSTRRR